MKVMCTANGSMYVTNSKFNSNSLIQTQLPGFLNRVPYCEIQINSYMSNNTQLTDQNN